MRGFSDDTELDAIAAQVRAFPPLPDGEVGRLLAAARDAPGGSSGTRLVEHSLSRVLDAVLARRPTAADLLDLYQEGSMAAATAVAEYAARGGEAAGLGRYVDRVVSSFLDAAVERDAAQRRADEEVVRQAELAEAAEVRLRRLLEREPTPVELAAALAWPEDRVVTVMEAVRQARAAYDEEISRYLDDEPPGGGDTE
ncbi:MAG: sigma-70 domain-containing protein [Candidatus Dormibacteria bacterium]